jgi:hypothetical protein
MKISNLVCKTCLWKPSSVMLIVKRLGRQIIKKFCKEVIQRTLVKLRWIRHADILKRAYLCLVSDTGSPEPLVLYTKQINIVEEKTFKQFSHRSYVKTMSADGGHFGPRSGSLNTILAVDHLRTIHSFNIHCRTLWDLNSKT